ncbi:5'-nucleotidase [Achromobacter sp. NPDC008082]|uniref:5'-nucleotidase n=1 Tax=Achromobacter sp. NPDC008082 TaxID=3363888 RepID=UPI0036E7E93A
MPYDFSQYLVIGISSRALFNLNAEHDIFVDQGLEAYAKFQLSHEDEPLAPGSGFPLVRSILNLNNLVPGKRKTEVVVMSRNSAETSLRIFNSIDHHQLDITRAALTGGGAMSPYLNAYGVDLFLSADEVDVQAAIDAGIAAARIYSVPEGHEAVPDQIRIAFDGDSVLFSDESERIYQQHGLDTFLKHERENARKPMAEGPFAKLLKTLSYLQFDVELPRPPIRTALITARNGPAHERVIRTLRAWNVRVDEAHFLGGAPKAPVLQAFKPHIFFDDQHLHLEEAAKSMPVAHVPYRKLKVGNMDNENL